MCGSWDAICLGPFRTCVTTPISLLPSPHPAASFYLLPDNNTSRIQPQCRADYRVTQEVISCITLVELNQIWAFVPSWVIALVGSS